MADRYLVIYHKRSGATDRRQAQAIQPPLKAVMTTERYQMLVDPEAAYLPLPRASGALIGSLFTRDASPRRVTALTAKEIDPIAATDGQSLIDTYWGGYCAFGCGRDAMRMYALRDPSGGLPCYWFEDDHHVILASDTPTLISAMPVPPPIDWQALYRHLYAYDLREPQTCLAGIQELLPGQRLAVTPNGTDVTSVWSPWTFTHAQTQTPVPRLRQVVDGCVNAWASGFERILLNVSGGLDSSICAAALRTTTASVVCLTMATDEAEGDERAYARPLAKAMDRELIEGFHHLSDIDLTRTGSGHLPRPVNYALGQSELALKRSLITTRAFDAVFTGVGGDNVFCHMPSATPIVDRLKAEGPIAAFATLLDICRMTDSSISEAFLAAVKRLKIPSPAYSWHADPSFLTPTLHPPRLTHPWLDAPPGALPGQSVHIAMLLRLQATTDGYDRALWPPQINPLVSQPLMELCLGIPSWKWCAGGRDRSVARAAYADLLPPLLIARRSKGGAGSFAHQIVTRNRTLLQSYLCDGLLATHGVVDVKALTTALDPKREIAVTDYLRLLFLAEAESWARHWHAPSVP